MADAPSRREKLQALLEAVLGSDAVYFQPPSNRQMVYPAIVYTLDDVDTRHANNLPYGASKRYMVTVIDRSPTSKIPDAIGQLPTASFSRHFVVDGLNHFAYTVYF